MIHGLTNVKNILNLEINKPGFSWQITSSVTASVFSFQYDTVLLVAKKGMFDPVNSARFINKFPWKFQRDLRGFIICLLSFHYSHFRYFAIFEYTFQVTQLCNNYTEITGSLCPQTEQCHRHHAPEISFYFVLQHRAAISIATECRNLLPLTDLYCFHLDSAGRVWWSPG